MGISDLAMKFMLVDMVSGGLQRVGANLERLEGQGKQLQQTWNQVTRDLQLGVKALLVTQELWQTGFKPGIDAAAELEKSLDRLEANLLDKNTSVEMVEQQMARLKATAQELGNPLPLDVTQVVEAETALKRAGLAIDDLVGKGGATSAASFLAVLEDIAPSEAATLIGDIGTQFKLTGNQYFELADQIARSSAASSTSAQELARALGFVGAKAKRLGIDYKTTLAILATEAKFGLKGSRGGTALESFLTRLAVPQGADAKKIQKALGLRFFEGGKFVGVDAAIARLKTSLSKLTDQQGEIVLQKLFGEEGGRTASALIGYEGGYQRLIAAADQQLGLEAKIQKQLEGHTGQANALLGTIKSIAADGFTPMINVMTVVENRLNRVAGKAAAMQSAHPVVNTIGSTAASAALLGVGGFAAYKLGKAGLGAMRVLRAPGAVGALMGTAGGMAHGMAAGHVAKQLGIQPVFVTNWPAGGVGVGGIGAGVGSAAGGAAEGAVGGRAVGLLGKVKGLLGIGVGGALAAGSTSVGALATGGAAGLGTLAAGGLAAGAAGYGIGSLIQKGLDTTGLAEGIQKALATALAAVGSDFGKAILVDAERSKSVQPVNLTVNVDPAGGVQTVGPTEGLGQLRVQARRHGGN